MRPKLIGSQFYLETEREIPGRRARQEEGRRAGNGSVSAVDGLENLEDALELDQAVRESKGFRSYDEIRGNRPANLGGEEP